MSIGQVTGGNFFGAVNREYNGSFATDRNSVFKKKSLKDEVREILAKNKDARIITENGRRYLIYSSGPHDDNGYPCPTEFACPTVYVDLETGETHRSGGNDIDFFA